MLSYPVILTSTAVVLVVVSVMVGLLFGSNMAMFVVLGLVVVIGYILFNFGTFSVIPKEDGADIDVQPIPNPSSGDDPGFFDIKEVFHIAGNQYTFDEAPAVCAAYGAELASYDQLVEAQSRGAEWCGYGWSATGMALFPTSQATWEALQQNPNETKRTACGHPGVNGGYFDPRLKFGVNCYGKKPPNMGTRLPQPLPGTDQAGFDAMVNKFKGMLTQMKLSPFSRDIWSVSGSGSTPAPTGYSGVKTDDPPKKHNKWMDRQDQVQDEDQDESPKEETFVDQIMTFFGVEPKKEHKKKKHHKKHKSDPDTDAPPATLGAVKPTA